MNPTQESPDPSSAGPAARPTCVLRGTTVTPGLVIGPVHRKDHELSRGTLRRVPLDQVEKELNRFHQSLADSKRQLQDLKRSLQGIVPREHVLILDTHLAYLKDSVFLSDVENLILNEQMALEAAITKVIGDFDRIFRLVQSDTLRERAVDLRDVGIRVLRNLERMASGETQASVREHEHILVARELSIVDMFDLDNQHVRGILTEAGSLSGHAAILANSMHIPTLTAVDGLLDAVAEGDLVIVDASEGVVRVRPDERVLAQYRAASALSDNNAVTAGRPEWVKLPAETRDRLPIVLEILAGNLPEVEAGTRLGLEGVGLYRTELLYLLDREQPSVDSLAAHYEAVLAVAGPEGVTFRLLDVDSSLRIPYLHQEREPNPALGSVGMRLLLAREDVLRRQLQALLRANKSAPLRLALPKVRDVADLRRVREILHEERYALAQSDDKASSEFEVGVVIELPTAALSVRELAAEADFLVVNVPSLKQYLLASDRANAALLGEHSELHPLVVRVLRSIVQAAHEHDRELSAFGAGIPSIDTLTTLIGAGIQHFCVVPSDLRSFLERIQAVDARQASRLAESALRASCWSDLNPASHALAAKRRLD